MDQVTYVPILKAKKGEYDALLKMPPADKRSVTPFLELQAIPLSWTDHKPTRTLRKHLTLLARSIAAWSTSGGSRVFVEVGGFSESPRVDGDSPLEFIVKEAGRLGGKPVPVTGLRRTPSIQRAIKRIAESSLLGVLVRLTAQTVLCLPMCSTTKLTRCCNELASTGRQCDLLFDFEEIPAGHSGFVAQAAVGLINSLPEIAKWRSIITTGSSMPKTMSGMPHNEVVRVVREEWMAWKAMSKQVPLKRLPVFGDYGVAHPESLQEGSFVGRNVAAKVR